MLLLFSASNAYPSPKAEQYEENEESETAPKPRRRREMQAITKIVETREFPYMDNYFWRNNGNTTQKKTGCRSIYYKCSNSNKVILKKKIWKSHHFFFCIKKEKGEWKKKVGGWVIFNQREAERKKIWWYCGKMTGIDGQISWNNRLLEWFYVRLFPIKMKGWHMIFMLFQKSKNAFI